MANSGGRGGVAAGRSGGRGIWLFAAHPQKKHQLPLGCYISIHLEARFKFTRSISNLYSCKFSTHFAFWILPFSDFLDVTYRTVLLETYSRVSRPLLDYSVNMAQSLVTFYTALGRLISFIGIQYHLLPVYTKINSPTSYPLRSVLNLILYYQSYLFGYLRCA